MLPLLPAGATTAARGRTLNAGIAWSDISPQHIFRPGVLRCLSADFCEEEILFVAAEAGAPSSVESACSFVHEDVLERLLQAALGTAGGEEAGPAALGKGRVFAGKPKR